MTTQFEAHCISVLLACQTVTAAQRLLGLSDDEVMGVRQRAVKRGLARRDLSPLRRGGLDEKSFLGGQSFVTVLSDLDGGCVLEVTRDRTQAAAEEALSVIPKEARGGVEAMALDMHQPFVNAVQTTLPTADIVHDRFHIKKHLNDAVNKVRRAEHKERLSTGDKRLSGTRYLFLRNPQDLSEAERLSKAAPLSSRRPSVAPLYRGEREWRLSCDARLCTRAALALRACALRGCSLGLREIRADADTTAVGVARVPSRSGFSFSEPVESSRKAGPPCAGLR